MNIWVAVYGIVFLRSGVIPAIQTYSWVSKAEVVEGRVIELVEKGADTYAPKVAYQISGVQRQFVEKWSSDPPRFKVGDRVAVFVSQDFTHEAIASMLGLYGGAILTMAVALAYTFTAIALVLGLNEEVTFATAAILAVAFMVVVFGNGDRILRILHPQLG